MEIEKDIGAEIIQKLEETNKWIIKAKEKLAEKDKKIMDLENKLKACQKENS
ncbi:MAG: hypothetical protein AABX17_00015 [Nanoarchaeota archaeon]